jgi:peptide/nickel transport system substrate-binding protein
MESLAAIEGDDSLGVVVQPSGAYLQLQMRESYKDGRKSPFADERVRQAMRYAINAEEINEIVQRGKGEVATQALPKDSPGYDPSIADAYPHDPEKAKALLAEAGYPDGFEFTMAIPGPGIKNMADQGQLLQDQLEQVGVTANIKPILGQDIATQYYIEGGGDAFAAARLASTFYPTAYDSQWGKFEFVAIWNGARAQS